jgi:hypothetical protein
MGARTAGCGIATNLTARGGDQRDLVIGVIKQVLQFTLGEGPLGRCLPVVLNMRGGIPLEQHLRGMSTEPLLTHPIPNCSRDR